MKHRVAAAGSWRLSMPHSRDQAGGERLRPCTAQVSNASMSCTCIHVTSMQVQRQQLGLWLHHGCTASADRCMCACLMKVVACIRCACLMNVVACIRCACA
jgi:hypothetical protein